MQKLKEKFSDNLGQKVCRLFHVLAQFQFTKSEAELDYHQQKVNERVASRVVERLRILGNSEISEKSVKWLYLMATQEATFDICTRKSAIKPSILKLFN